MLQISTTHSITASGDWLDEPLSTRFPTQHISAITPNQAIHDHLNTGGQTVKAESTN